jgi:hypothetical protein
MARFPHEEWSATHCRLTVFPTPEGDLRKADWWREITDSEPSQVTEDRKRRSSVAVGEVQNRMLALGLAPDRIDLTLSANEIGFDPGLAFEPLGPILDTIQEFSRLVDKFLGLSDIPDLVRLAFGAALLHTAADHAAAYLQLRDYIPVCVEPTWRDFLYQVNVAKEFAQNGALGLPYLNRLSRWSTYRFTPGMFLISDQSVTTRQAASKFGVRLDLDINTPAESQSAIRREQVVPIYNELVEAAIGIAREGVANEQYRLE